MFAVLHVPVFSLQAVLRLEPSLATQPVALLDEQARPPVVSLCSTVAAAAGVEVGQTAAQAMARCAGVVLRVARPAADAEARAGLLAAAFSVSPQVENTAPGVCTLVVSGVAAARRVSALEEAVTQLATLGLQAVAGLAATPWLALCAAREAALRGERCVSIAPGGERNFLRDLPLTVAEPSPECATVLTGWGVTTLGALTALTKADVTQRLGPEGLALWERAAGEVTRPLRLTAPAQTFAADMALEHEIETLEPLLFILRRFIDRLALELRTAGFSAGELELTLTLTDETTCARVFRLPEPTTREDVLFRVLHTYLETLQTAATVCGVALVCRPVRPPLRQDGLFESVLHDPYGFVETLGRIAALVGPDRLGTPVPVDTHRPDAISLVPPPPVVPPEAPPAVHPPFGLPLRRYRPPRPATVELDGAAPAFVWAPGGVQGAVIARSGPWRSSGEWWDASRGWRREEWDVELEGGGVHRLLHTAEGWFVEGEYD